MPRKKIPADMLIALHEALQQHPKRSRQRRQEFLAVVRQTGMSETTVRRQYYHFMNLNIEGRADRGQSRVVPTKEMEEWISMVAAVQLATRNKKGHMCSTRRAIQILEQGVSYGNKPFQLPAGKLKVSTANRWLHSLRIRKDRKFRQVVPIHFRARHSNELWQVDISPSDAKYFGTRMRKDGRKPYIYAVTDDHSGIVYAEYRETRDEDVQAGLEVIYAAMAPKKESQFPFQGIPQCFYFDPGRVGVSPLVKQVLEEKLGSKVRVHLSDRATGKLKKASRAKGKIEKSFLFFKEDFESLFHFHRPKDVDQANQWLKKYLLTHMSRPHPETGIDGTRIEIWAKDLPAGKYQKVCDPDIFWSYVLEPERRTVGPDARLILDNKHVYVLDSDLAGEKVEVWYAADNKGIHVKDAQGKVYGPYLVSLRPIPAGEFRQHKKTPLDRTMERIVALSKNISIPQESIYSDQSKKPALSSSVNIKYQPFKGPEPFKTIGFKSIRNFYQAFYNWFKKPVGTLSQEIQEELDVIFKEFEDPDELWRQSQKLLRKHKLVK
jgi:hypothetical protein